MRRLDSYIQKYGPVAGPKLYRTMQSKAAHAGVSARLRKKIAALQGNAPAKARRPEGLPLFPEAPEATALVASN